MTFKKSVAVLHGVCAVEEAEPLFEWLQAHPQGKVNLKRCDHLHAACLQVLISTGAQISLWPTAEDLRPWIESALSPPEIAEATP